MYARARAPGAQVIRAISSKFRGNEISRVVVSVPARRGTQASRRVTYVCSSYVERCLPNGISYALYLSRGGLARERTSEHTRSPRYYEIRLGGYTTVLSFISRLHPPSGCRAFRLFRIFGRSIDADGISCRASRRLCFAPR